MILPIVGGFVTVILAAGGVYSVVHMHTYNHLVSLQAKYEQVWSNIDVRLKQRSGELPNRIETVQQYMDDEQETLQQGIGAQSQAQRASNPELKPNESVPDRQDRISSIEEQISDRRELSNEASTNDNTLIKQIPHVFVSTQMSLTPRKLHGTPEGATEDADISDAFSSEEPTSQSNT